MSKAFPTASGHRWLLSCLLLTGTSLRLAAQTDMPIYTDSLQPGWAPWGWATIINYNNTSPVHSGSASISVTIQSTSDNWEAIYIHHDAFDSSLYSSLRFWVNGGPSGGQQLQVQGILDSPQAPFLLPLLPTNSWQQITIPLASLGVDGKPNFTGFWIQDRIGTPQPTFYLDDISLVANPNPLPTVSLTSPADGSIYSTPATINLAASVNPNGHSITKVQFYNGTNLLGEDSTSPYVFTWTNVSLGSYSLTARAIYDSGSSISSAAANVTVAGNTPVAITVDAQLNRHPISPLIYGVAFASSSQLADLNFPLNRSGGNAETRYNWLLNAHNRGADWYFESLDDGATPGKSADDFITQTRSGGAEPMLTVPMIGWAPKLGPSRGRLASFSIAKYGPQTGNDWQWFPDAGNGISSTNNNQPIVNDPNDANFPTNSAFQQAWIQHLTNRWGLSTNGGVSYYFMDNEHSIWHGTHRDVHPIGATMQEIRDKFFDYAGRVKAVDPAALVLAPEEWGWNGYFWSGYDQQWSGAHNDWNPAHFPDRGTNGGWDYLPWLLDQFRQRATNTHQRLLDYFTVHFYPQGGEYGDDVSQATQLLRNRSTRSLWDANYVDASWINSVIKLIPRMKSWVAAYYPGTKIGITEYNWRAENHINGATTQADILGIFGREGLDLATRWTTPDTSTPTYKAMKIYRNYDGNKSTFGDTSVNAAGPNPDDVSTFAAVRSSDGALTTMVINKQLASGAAATVIVTNFLANGTAQAWQLTAANTITRLSDISFTGNTFTATVPPQSITLFVLPAGTTPPPPHLRPGVLSSTGTFDFWLDGQAGQRYLLHSTTNFLSWEPVQTNTLASNSWHIVIPASTGQRFYRGQWAP